MLENGLKYSPFTIHRYAKYAWQYAYNAYTLDMSKIKEKDVIIRISAEARKRLKILSAKVEKSMKDYIDWMLSVK